ncbi:MAG: hypothetical protein ACREEQ_00110, partial [Caulobacteraceae bacterium]
ALMIEIEERHNPGGLARIFEALAGDGYRARCVVEGRLGDAPSVEDLAAQVAGEPDYINNFFFIPRERLSQVD